MFSYVAVCLWGSEFCESHFQTSRSVPFADDMRKVEIIFHMWIVTVQYLWFCYIFWDTGEKHIVNQPQNKLYTIDRKSVV